MPNLKTILVVDDSAINRMILAKVLSEEYTVLQAENGQTALALLEKHGDEIVAMMLDIVMPILDGYGVLKLLRTDTRYSNLPILVMTENNDSGSELKALALGAWDFVSKPYHPQIIHFRLKNAIERSQLSALKQLQYLAEYDALTGIYNKTKFFEATRNMLHENPGERFILIRLDVDRFQLINSFFGTAEGDRLLVYLAEHLIEDAKSCEKVTYGRIGSDIFAYCTRYVPAAIEVMIAHAKETLAKYNPNYDIVPSIGLYLIEDGTIPVEEMYNRATLAAKSCKGNYVDYYAYYNESMSRRLTHEQEIVNNMNNALENGQFEIYLQPQYNIHTNLPCGAEVLVRWLHPKNGMLLPGEFVPVFERNGFITKLDYAVWEKACRCLHAWIAQGIKPYPLSVNISRVNMYNPKLAENLMELVERYQISPALLNLELTESAYTDNPTAMKKMMKSLQGYGFTIMMDDFGSGYSSLALLKDIAIDILKIDMRFLSATEIPGRGENIIASVIRMAKWLNIPVVAEGAETSEQVDFLRSVGCDYVQGYYFAHPMPVLEYEQLCHNQLFDAHLITDKIQDHYRYDDLFSSNQEMKLLFNNALQAAVIYEFVDDQIEMIRVNEAYYALLGHGAMAEKLTTALSVVDEAYRETLMDAFRTCAKTQETVECEYMRRKNGAALWIYTKLHYVFTAGNKSIIIGELVDITMRKAIDFEVKKYKESLLASTYETHTVLIVDDAMINRTILKKILKNKFIFLEAENGAEAVKLLHENQNRIDLILLDISMPVMDGKEFLQYKKNLPELDGIPVIMITADDSPQQQISTLSLGANDYIVKPFIPEVVTRRISNVLESNRRFKKMVKEYNDMSEQVKTDRMTGLLNRASAELMITQCLENSATGTCAMLMLDIDNFKKFNDTRGHAYGDRVINAVAERLRGTFRQGDVVARMGGDEFAVFMENVPDITMAELKAGQLCKSIAEIELDEKNAAVTCSVGIAITTPQGRCFETLYQNADKALYRAKCHGRNTVSAYSEEPEAALISSWISDTGSLLDAINDNIYAFDHDTYELLYVNDAVCRFAGVTREECKGRKCYEVLMHQTKPCAFCSLLKTAGEAVHTRLFRVPNSEQILLMRGKNIHLNGIVVHLEVAVDATKIENMGLYECLLNKSQSDFIGE